MKKYFSTADIAVIAITFILFAAALFTKGFTNALLLEAGVLLVSVKIIMMNFKCSQTNKQILEKLRELDEDIKMQSK
ncbi:MAG: hypothetical protein V2I34_01035 [Bacteroidales bacterium]|jgi:hypothetical protein|nr:hypothetical protein [Bacteroidales bacterium]